MLSQNDSAVVVTVRKATNRPMAVALSDYNTWLSTIVLAGLAASLAGAVHFSNWTLILLSVSTCILAVAKYLFTGVIGILSCEDQQFLAEDCDAVKEELRGGMLPGFRIIFDRAISLDQLTLSRRISLVGHFAGVLTLISTILVLVSILGQVFN